MRPRRPGPVIQAATLSLLLVGLGIGVPVHFHAHHDGDGAHLGAPGHGHGVALVRQEMRVERPAPPTLPAVRGAVSAFPLLPSPRSVAAPPREEPCCDSRAPPDLRPRAPPA